MDEEISSMQQNLKEKVDEKDDETLTNEEYAQYLNSLKQKFKVTRGSGF